MEILVHPDIDQLIIELVKELRKRDYIESFSRRLIWHNYDDYHYYFMYMHRDNNINLLSLWSRVDEGWIWKEERYSHWLDARVWEGITKFRIDIEV